MDIIISQHTEGQPCSCSSITQSVNKAPKAVSLGKASHQAPGSLLPTEPLLTEKASSTKNGYKGGGRGEEQKGRQGGGEYLPPNPGTSPAFCELPVSSEADTGAGRSGDLREVWEPPPRGNCLPSWVRKEGSPGRNARCHLSTEGPGPHV